MKRLHGLAAFALVASGCARLAPAPTEPSKVGATMSAGPPRVAFVGEGSLEARGERTAPTRLAIEKVVVSAVTSGDVAETTVEHVFRNDADELLEGTFRFPLPDGAMITGLALEIDGRLVDGELVEREKARKAYEQVVDRMRDPALLEWDGGPIFKVRVFPIEPRRTKRVVVRFVAPLDRAGGGLTFAVRPPADALGAWGRTSLVLDGQAIDPRAAPRAATGELLIPVAGKAPDAVSETTKDGTYLRVELRPVLPDGGPLATESARPTGLIVLCDRSRSMLEARKLQVRVLSLLLAQLGEQDRFELLAGDVGVRAMPGGLRPVAGDASGAATAFVDGVEPDGASDLSKLLLAGGAAAREARANGFDPVVAYLGDASPTWGETRAAELARVASEALAGASLHVVLLGSSTDDATARALVAAGHGRLLRPKTDVDARTAAEQVARASRARRVEGVHLLGAEGLDVPDAIASTIYEGDAVALTLFVPKGTPTPTPSLVGVFGGKPVTFRVPLDSAEPTRHVAQRWASAKIEAMQREGDAKKEDIVRTSLDYGIMSRFTSFLVLESDEAYAQLQIKRRAREAEAGDTRVSGRDLESADGASPSVSPDHLQPGDPEVRIPAPADAQSVVVVFPFGETKTAVFEGDAQGGAWVVRFLVDRRTPDGTYEILVRVTHHDGRVQILKLPYVVDTKAPHLRVVVRRTRGRTYQIGAQQELTAEEIAAQAPGLTGTLDDKRRQAASLLTDAKRVEVRTPDGQVLSLTHLRLGEFVGRWTPSGTQDVAPGARLHVVAVDRALNESAIDVEVP